MSATLSEVREMVDVQAGGDTRQVEIDRVGVSGVRYPVVVVDERRERQHTVATVAMTVALPHHERGTHMSRFLEELHQHREVSPAVLPELARGLLRRLHAETAHVEMAFSLFREKVAPVSGARGLMEFECRMEATVSEAGPPDLVVGVSVPVTTLCPCSREIADRGAHNQRGVVELRVRTAAPLHFEELIDAIEESASCALYPVLKRTDEKWVTERAYDNPRFVEDLLREVAVQMRADPRVRWYHVTVENQESIHAHNAYASLERWK